MGTADDDAASWSGPPPEVAPLNARLAAKLIDQLLMIPLNLFAASVTFVVMGLSVKSLPQAGRMPDWASLSSSQKGAGILAAAAWALPLGLTVYQWVLLSTRGQTLGKRLCSIRIVDLAARPAGFFRALFFREWIFGLFMGLLSVPLSLLNPFLMPLVLLLDPALLVVEGRRTLHDYFAGTQVRWVRHYELGRLRLAWGLIAVGTVAIGVSGFVAYQAREELSRRILEARPMNTLNKLPSMPSLGTGPATPPVKSKPGAFYRYVDGDGVVYVVDDFAKVPERYRNRAEEMK